jgi:hypothetical protein
VTGAILAPHETQRRVVSGKTGIYPSVSPGKSICVPIDPGGEMVTPFLGHDQAERAIAYKQWLDAGIAPKDLQHLRAYASQERALGDERFQRMVETTLGRSATYRPRGRPRLTSARDEA